MKNVLCCQPTVSFSCVVSSSLWQQFLLLTIFHRFPLHLTGNLLLEKKHLCFAINSIASNVKLFGRLYLILREANSHFQLNICDSHLRKQSSWVTEEERLAWWSRTSSLADPCGSSQILVDNEKKPENLQFIRSLLKLCCLSVKTSLTMHGEYSLPFHTLFCKHNAITLRRLKDNLKSKSWRRTLVMKTVICLCWQQQIFVQHSYMYWSSVNPVLSSFLVNSGSIEIMSENRHHFSAGTFSHKDGIEEMKRNECLCWLLQSFCFT